MEPLVIYDNDTMRIDIEVAVREMIKIRMSSIRFTRDEKISVRRK